MNLTTDQLQRGVEAYQNWKANVGNEASSAFGGNLHELARRMYEAMAESARPEAPRLGYVQVELSKINHLTTRLKELAEAGSRDAKSLAADAALLLEAHRG